MKILFGISRGRFLHSVVPARRLWDMQEGRATRPSSSEDTSVCGSESVEEQEEVTGRGRTRNLVSSLEPSAQDGFSAAGGRKGWG